MEVVGREGWQRPLRSHRSDGPPFFLVSEGGADFIICTQQLRLLLPAAAEAVVEADAVAAADRCNSNALNYLCT